MTTSRPARALIVGAGLMGRWHAHALAKVDGTVAGIIDKDMERAQVLARRLDSVPAFEDLASALNSAEADVLHVCTPPDSHAGLVEQGIDAGLQLMVEKPLAPDEATTRRLFNMAAEKGVKLCPVFQFLYQPGVLRGLELLPSLGRIRHIATSAYSAGAQGRSPEARDAVALEILPHPVSLLHRFVDGDLAALDWNVLNPAPGELRASAATEGMSLSILVSMGGRPTSNEMWIHGEEGSLYFDLFHGYCVRFEGDVSRGQKITRPFWVSVRTGVAAGVNLAGRIVRDEPAYPGLRDLIAKFYQAIDLGHASPIDSLEVIDNAAAIERISKKCALSRAEPEADVSIRSTAVN